MDVRGLSKLTVFEDYLESVELPKLLEEIGVKKIGTLMEEVKHFTEK